MKILPTGFLNKISKPKSIITNEGLVKYNKHLKISENLSKDVYDKLDEASSAITNYAKHNKVDFVFQPIKENEKNIGIVIDAYKDSNVSRAFMYDDVNKVVTHEITPKRFVEDEDGLTKILPSLHTTEDNFLRQIYRNMEAATKKIINK